MNKIDPKLVEQHFAAHYKRGAIIRFLMECDDPNLEFKQKFAILLNKNTADDEAILAITTSQVQKFTSAFLANDTLRIGQGKNAAFVLETIIDLRTLKMVPKADLQNACANKQMSFVGDLDAGDMTEVDQKITNSKLIERGIKKKIV